MLTFSESLHIGNGDIYILTDSVRTEPFLKTVALRLFRSVGITGLGDLLYFVLVGIEISALLFWSGL